MSNKQNLKEAIVNAINSIDTPDTVVVLKGFNRWLDDINGSFLFNSNISTPDSIQMNHIIAKLNADNERIYALYEDLIILSDLSLGGIIEAYNKHIVILDNDLYQTFYPSVFQDSVSSIIKDNHELDSDNIAQRFYGAVEEYHDTTYIAYNDIPNIKYDSVSISSLLRSKNEQYEFSDDCLEIPEEYDAVVLSGLITEAIESGTGRFSILEDKADVDPNLIRLRNILEPIGIVFNRRAYSTIEPTVDPEDMQDYIEILHRKNPTYTFRNLTIYKNPYEGNETTEVNQVTIINDIVQNAMLALGNEPFRDIFVTAPTGAGKSVMFQIPAIYLAEKFDLVTIVISPLIGLMNDQVSNISSMTDKAATINSDYTPTQKEDTLLQVKDGNKSIIYLSPESLLSNTDICNLIGDRRIGLVVVDEAHIVATWGKSFRPDYWYLGDFINRLRNSSKSEYMFPIVTFTATATFGGDDNMYQDIIESLRMTPNKYIGNVRRSDISFEIKCLEKDHAYKEEKLATATESINKLAETGDKVLVYVPYTQHIADLYGKLEEKDKASRYFGGMPPGEKNETLQAIKDGTKNVVLATKAFGMGIDIDDIKYVYHFAPTGNIADYVQEIGRVARRPDMLGIAKTDFYKEDFRYINQLYGMSSVKNFQIIATLRKIFELYTRYNKRNFLASSEEFSPIFADLPLEQVDARLKTTLLMIRKDFESDPNIGYPPIVFKPRSMFTFGYFMIKDGYIPVLKNKGMLKYFEKLPLPRVIRQSGTGINNGIVTTTSPGDTYKLNFKRLWEDKYRDMSFGMFKRSFMTNELPDFNYEVGNSLINRIVLNVDGGNRTLSAIRVDLLNFLDSLKVVFDDFRQAGTYFGYDDLLQALLKTCAIKKKYIAETLAGSVVRLIERIPTNSVVLSGESLRFTESNSVTGKFRIKNSTYESRIYALKKTANSFLNNAIDSKTTRYTNKTDSLDILVVQLLDILELAQCEMMSGTNPEFFIRVNNAYAIERILNNPNYVSHTVAAVGQKHKESCNLMRHFFTRLTRNEDRWDFIEKYFLGQLDPKDYTE